MRRALACALVLAAGCTAEPAPAPVAIASRWAIRGDAARGRALFESMECTRCHEHPVVEPPPAARDCTGCHRAIHAGTHDAPAAAIARWSARITSLVHVPALGRSRLSRDWIARFLIEPHDVRPALAATMPRLPIDARDAADLATFLVPDEPLDGAPLPRDAETIARGRALFEARGCASCHAPSAIGTLDPALALAPDLRWTRERMTDRAIVDWILDPSPPMPRLVAAREDAVAIAAYLVSSALDPIEIVTPADPLPLLDRPVSFTEVRDRVLRRTCWHCHSDAGLALGEGGPGNTGGFGFAARRLDLSDYEGVMSGSLDDAGERRSIFREVDGVPLLVAVLEARASEERGHASELRGMPLGLPAVSPEEIQIVRSWIAQGRPQ
ncbi:c-type cytochrome [Sandaracinus amylolyticus]|uniref:Cytochrome c domain-containing protein n=1 Tax=Sandaracinus amylolyticus TaxID=927083 RepID=A0A0F6YM28_9BACT|nr:cytochrome c [Sandaracinus amylolyticus]AKF08972.1 hypothetical protein DB32_006121 [Sandaracinus amylolyticus]